MRQTVYESGDVVELPSGKIGIVLCEHSFIPDSYMVVTKGFPNGRPQHANQLKYVGELE